MTPPCLLLIDNYDSFTWNLAQAFMALGAEVDVRRNNTLSVDEAIALEPTHLCVSPGPGRPEDAGISLGAMDAFHGRIPVLGVCLGHQALALLFGATVVRAAPIHGKASTITHDGKGLFQGLPHPLTVARYHSLVADATSIPDTLEVSARTVDGLVMGLRHRELPTQSVQFHPESILTPDGPKLLENFLFQ